MFFALEGDTISVLQGCSLYKYPSKDSLEQRGSEGLACKMCRNPRGPQGIIFQ